MFNFRTESAVISNTKKWMRLEVIYHVSKNNKVKISWQEL